MVLDLLFALNIMCIVLLIVITFQIQHLIHTISMIYGELRLSSIQKRGCKNPKNVQRHKIKLFNYVVN